MLKYYQTNRFKTLPRETYFSSGKLLITSEYFVLDGATALAVPTILGQEMMVETILDKKNIIIWKAFHETKEWLYIKINAKNWEILESNIKTSAEFVLKVFKIINDLNPEKFLENRSYIFETNLQFPANFGLGSSSTLMANLANWANVNPFLLNENSLGGSGYDIAIAEQNSAILFQKTERENQVEKVEFNPPYLEDLILIHLNQKQNSREGIELYRSKEKSEKLIQKFSSISKSVLKCADIVEFSSLMESHEAELSRFLGLKTVKELHFPDCPVFVKSLGAWGGDFVLSRKFENYKTYFQSKNFSTIFDWNEIVKTFSVCP